METYLKTLDLWEAIEEDYDVLPLLNNPTMNQIRIHKEKKKKGKGKVVSICRCLSNHLHNNHGSQISKSNLGLPREGICWR